MFGLRIWWFAFCLSFRCDLQLCVTFAGFFMTGLLAWVAVVYVIYYVWWFGVFVFMRLLLILFVGILWYALLDCLWVYLICELLRAVRLIVWLLYVYSCFCALCCFPLLIRYFWFDLAFRLWFCVLSWIAFVVFIFVLLSDWALWFLTVCLLWNLLHVVLLLFYFACFVGIDLTISLFLVGLILSFTIAG